MKMTMTVAMMTPHITPMIIVGKYFNKFFDELTSITALGTMIPAHNMSNYRHLSIGLMLEARALA